MAMTSSRWMSPPIVYAETIPSSQSTIRMRASVMSMFVSSVLLHPRARATFACAEQWLQVDDATDSSCRCTEYCRGPDEAKSGPLPDICRPDPYSARSCLNGNVASPSKG